MAEGSTPVEPTPGSVIDEGEGLPTEEEEEASVENAKQNRYSDMLDWAFRKNYTEGAERVEVSKEDIEEGANELGLKRPKNPGDPVYSFRNRGLRPRFIGEKTPQGKRWHLRGIARGRYAFIAIDETLPLRIEPQQLHAQVKVPDATPAIVARFAQGDEQALLARLRYARLIDIFTGVACYSLQSHLRTTVEELGQVEVDELYVGVDRSGAHYIFPVEAKGDNENVHIGQIEQGIALCRERFPELICRPLAAQFLRGREVVVLFEFEESPDIPRLRSEEHYRLIPAAEIDADELLAYKQRLAAAAGSGSVALQSGGLNAVEADAGENLA